MIFKLARTSGWHALSLRRAWFAGSVRRRTPRPSRTQGVPPLIFWWTQGVPPVAIILLCLTTFVAPTTAQDAIRWNTAAAVAGRLEKPLETGVQWSGRALRDGLRNWSRSDGVRIAILLDRRADPGRPMELNIADGTLADALNRIADHAELGWCQIGPVIYFGPPATARRLRTVVELRKEELPKAPSAVASKLRRVKAWRWNDLATPRELVEEMAHEGELKLEGLQLIPHDLWGGADLPPMPAFERLSLVLAGYDLTFAVDAPTTLRLVPMPAKVALTRSYALGATGDAALAALKEKYADAELLIDGSKLKVVGRAEDHAAISAALAGKSAKPAAKKAPPKLAQVRASLKAKNQPVGQLLGDVAKTLTLDLVIDREAIAAAKLSLDTRVSVELTNAPVAELLSAITKPAGLAFELRGRTVRIKPASPEIKL